MIFISTFSMVIFEITFHVTLFLEPHRNRQQRVKSVNWEAKDELEKSLGQEIAFYDWIRHRLDRQVQQTIKT